MNRIKLLRRSKDIKQIDLAKELGVAQSTLSYWEQGKYDIDNSSLRKLADVFGCTTDYILGHSDYSHPIKNTPSGGVKIPVLGRVQAGLPIEAVQDILDYEEITPELAAKGEYFALKVQGDSMAPQINAGDVVIVRKQPDVECGQVAIVIVNGDDATVKKFVKHEQGVSLVSYNSAFPPIFYTYQEVSDKPVTVIGRVVELRRSF